jgi:hypothetical protein
MRIRFLIFCLAVLAVCFWLLLHRTAKQSEIKPPVIQIALTNQSSVLKNQQSEQAKPQKSMAKLPSQRNPLDFLTRLGIDTNSKTPVVQQLMQKPINFYGEVLDENSNPVVGANIQFRWDDMTAQNWTKVSTTESDSEGLFSLRDKIGSTLTVSVGKEGYYTPHSGQGSFQYALGNPNFSSNPYNPAIFYLRKKGQGAELIQKDFPPLFTQIWQLHHDGTPIELDLLNDSQNVAGSGQLKLEFWRDISNLHKQPFDWKLQLSMLGGGLVPTDKEFAFQAPESGYQPSIVIDMPATNQDWLGEFRSKYYIQLPNGNYGRFNFYLLPRNGVFTVHSAINPSGSRNLEPK